MTLDQLDLFAAPPASIRDMIAQVACAACGESFARPYGAVRPERCPGCLAIDQADALPEDDELTAEEEAAEAAELDEWHLERRRMPDRAEVIAHALTVRPPP